MHIKKFIFFSLICCSISLYSQEAISEDSSVEIIEESPNANQDSEEAIEITPQETNVDEQANQETAEEAPAVVAEVDETPQEPTVEQVALEETFDIPSPEEAPANPAPTTEPTPAIEQIELVAIEPEIEPLYPTYEDSILFLDTSVIV